MAVQLAPGVADEPWPGLGHTARICPGQAQHGLPTATVPLLDKNEADTSARRKQIMQELIHANAQRIVVLGDIPIQQFLRQLCNTPARNLAYITELAGGYGAPWRTQLDGRPVEVIGPCHSRQVARLGSSSAIRGPRHDAYIAQMR